MYQNEWKELTDGKEAIAGFYKPEHILTTHIEHAADHEQLYRIHFTLPPYDRQFVSTHASSNQIDPAVLEGLYIVTHQAFKAGIFAILGMTAEEFLANRGEVVIVKKDYHYRPNPTTGELLKNGEPTYIDVELQHRKTSDGIETPNVRMMHGKVWAVFEITGVVRGKAICALSVQQSQK